MQSHRLCTGWKLGCDKSNLLHQALFVIVCSYPMALGFTEITSFILDALA